MKNLVRFVAFFVLSTLLVSQSVVDVAKKEQERREKLKGKNAKVITNADLKSVNRAPALTTQAAPPAEVATAKPVEANEPEARQAERSYMQGAGSTFASAVLPDTALVENPEFALGAPDGQYAEISMLGALDLQMSVRNGPGDDIEVFARHASGQEGTPAGDEEGVLVGPFEGSWPGGFWYGVLAMGESGDWEVIGQGTGIINPESFDLGGFESIKSIRIIFRPHANPSLQVKLPTSSQREITIGIDAVEALH